MKKFVSVLTVAVLVLSLAVPAFAASVPSKEFPIDAVSEVPTVGDAVDANGQKVEIVVSTSQLGAGETLESVAEDAVKAAEDAGLDIKDATAAEVFDIKMADGSQPNGSVTVTIVREANSGDIAAVMYQRADGGWDSAKFTDNGDGTVTITFEHFCTVVLLTKAPTSAADVPTSGSSSSGSASTSSKPTSPQTGY